MFHIVIADGTTFIYRDNNIMGLLINHEGIKEIVNSLPVSRYFATDSEGKNKEISKEQAYMLYDMLMDYQKNHKENIKERNIAKYRKRRN